MAKAMMSSGATNAWSGEEFSSLLVDQIFIMLKKESAHYTCVDYLEENEFCSVLREQDAIDQNWRQRSAEWMFKVKVNSILHIHLFNTANLVTQEILVFILISPFIL